MQIKHLAQWRTDSWSPQKVSTDRFDTFPFKDFHDKVRHNKEILQVTTDVLVAQSQIWM